MPREFLEELEAEAKNRDISMNALLNQILSKYLSFDVFAENVHPVVFPRESLLSIIHYLTAEQLEQAGNAAGSKVLHSLFTHYNITPTLDSIIRNYLRPMDKYSGWFKARYYEEEKRIALHHDMGIKWSRWLKGYEGASLRSNLKIEPKVEISESSVIIYLRKQTLE